MVSYKPFQRLLVDKQVQPTELMHKLGISSATMAKLNAKKRSNDHVSLAVIERICLYFNCSISEVVEITKPAAHPYISWNYDQC